MEIRPHSQFQPTKLGASGSAVNQKIQQSKESDEVSTDASQQAKDLLEGGETSRPEVVARGKELLNSPDYPPKEVVDKLANFLADKLK